MFAITVHEFVPVHSPSVAAHTQILPEPLLLSQELGDVPKVSFSFRTPRKDPINLVGHLDLDAQFVGKGKNQARVLLEHPSHGHDVDAILDALPCHFALLSTTDCADQQLVTHGLLDAPREWLTNSNSLVCNFPTAYSG